MKDGKLTILVSVPAYNAEKYIRKNLEAVTSLDPPPERIVVVDDGSTDKTLEIIQSFKDVEIVSHKKNLGLAAARNTVLKLCDMDIIVYFDSDTAPEKDFLKKIKSCYDSNIAGAGGIAIEHNMDSLSDRWRAASMKQALRPSGEAPFLWGLCSSYKVSALNDVGGFDPLFRTNGEDVDIGIRLRKKGYSLLTVPEAKVLHLKGENLKSIFKATYNWYFWGAYALKKNREPYILNYVKIIFKNPFTRIFSMDGFSVHPFFLMMDLLAFMTQSYALFKAVVKRYKGK